MKKYPIHYKGKEYEVRWEEECYRSVLCIYEVKKIYIFKIYKLKSYAYEREIIDKVEFKGICKSHPDFYIEEIKMLFKDWEEFTEEQNKRQLIKAAKENALKEWNGVI